MKAEKPIRILASGTYLPRKVSSTEIEEMYNLQKGWAEQFSGVKYRHRATFETNGYMGARAVEDALKNAGIKLADVDLLISASATYDYPLPSQSSIIKKELTDGLINDIPTLDIDTTCLSFVSAFDLAARYLDGEQYSTIVIVSSEIASKGLTPKRPETLTLFGDGAAAFIVTYDRSGESALIKSQFKTYSEGVEHTIIRGGGNALFFKDHPYDEQLHSFDMNGIKLLKLTKKVFPLFIEDFFRELPHNFTELDLIVPHQASKTGNELVRNMYDFRPGQFKGNLANYGNCIAASIPLLLHEVIQNGEIKRGDECLLLGTSAGFSIGAALIRY